jgi:hypothetical protein
MSQAEAGQLIAFEPLLVYICLINMLTKYVEENT